MWTTQMIVAPVILVTVAISVPTALIIALMEDRFFDGLWIPFVQQAMREGASYFIFGTGMTICCVCLIIIGRITEQWMLTVYASMQPPSQLLPIGCRACRGTIPLSRAFRRWKYM